MTAKSWFADGIQGRHVLMGLAGFFGVMLIANAIFTYYAVVTFGGGDTSDPYRKGIRYNETITAAARQEERGWLGLVAYSQDAGQVSLRLADGSGAAVAGLELGGTIGRPATDQEDIQVTFGEQSPGVYVAGVRLAPGQWTVTVASRDLTPDEQTLFRLKKRLWVEAAP